MHLLMPIMSMMKDSGPPPNGGESVPFSAVELLINAEAQGATADDFIDISTATRTITRNNATTVRSNAVPVFGSYGISMPATPGRVDFSVGSAADWKFLHDGTVTWTIDLWWDPADFAVARNLVYTGGHTTVNIGLDIEVSTARKVFFGITRGVNGQTVVAGEFATALANNTNPRHLRFTYDHSLGSANAKGYENGSSLGSLTKTGNAPSTSNPTTTLHMFGYSNGTLPGRGGADEVRIVKGYALPALLQDTAWPTS